MYVCMYNIRKDNDNWCFFIGNNITGTITYVAKWQSNWSNGWSTGYAVVHVAIIEFKLF